MRCRKFEGVCGAENSELVTVCWLRLNHKGPHCDGDIEWCDGSTLCRSTAFVVFAVLFCAAGWYIAVEPRGE